MEKTVTNRGFALIRFTDDNGVLCTIQKSSSALADKIWLGAEDIGLKRFTKGIGWQDVVLTNTVEDSFIANNRMHLTQETAKELIKVLQKFVDTGEI